MDRVRILAPNFQKITGIGTSTAATQPSNVPLQLTLRALNMYIEKRGNAAPASERKNVLAAMAEAALITRVSKGSMRMD